MRIWKNISVIALAMSLFVFVGCGVAPSSAPEQKAVTQASGPNSSAQTDLIVKVLDVGQGDAILVRSPEQVVLIDTGDVGTKEKLVSYIKKEGIRTIDKVIITHAHADHLGGMAAVVEAFTLKQIYDSGFAATTNMYRQYLTTAKKKNIPFTVLTAGDQVDIGGGAILKILAPGKPYIKGSESDINNNSIVAKLVHGKFTMLLTGDAEKESEEQMLEKSRGDLKSLVLKSGHHGSRSSSIPAFLKAVAAETVIISVGASNDYHHPHPAVIKRYSDAKLSVYRTDQHGTVTITSNGQSYKISKEK